MSHQGIVVSFMPGRELLAGTAYLGVGRHLRVAFKLFYKQVFAVKLVLKGRELFGCQLRHLPVLLSFWFKNIIYRTRVKYTQIQCGNNNFIFGFRIIHNENKN